MLSEVVPGPWEPSGGRHTSPSSSWQTHGGPTACPTSDYATLHDTSLSCFQAVSRQHDWNHDLSARCIQPHQWPRAGLGAPRGNDGPISPADHWHATPERHTQAVTSSGARAESLSRNLLIRLLNSSNTCYINASVRAWLFAVHYLSVTDVLRYGTQVQAWRDIFYTRRPVRVHALSSWKSILKDWANLHMQHDACEFLEHILGKGRPPVLQGRWESRLASSTGIETRERHHMHKAITLHFPTPHDPTYLSRLFEHWHRGGPFVQACATLPSISILRISRFQTLTDDSVSELHTRVAIPPRVTLPYFPGSSEHCEYVEYHVAACILHCGQDITAATILLDSSTIFLPALHHMPLHNGRLMIANQLSPLGLTP